MTDTRLPAPAEIEDALAEIDAPRHRRPLAFLRSSWTPVVVVTLLTVLALRYYGVPFGTTVLFLGYVAGGIMLPGTLLWRAAYHRSGWFVADVAAGTAVGYALEVLIYIPARAAGLPLLVLAAPIVTIGVFLAIPRLRRYWRGSRLTEDRTPTWWAWSVAAVVAILVFWSCNRFFRAHGLSYPLMAAPDADSPMHLALIGDAKHHMPLMSSWLSDEPLLYHWFVYPEMAATSWVTGIEPQVLLLRLSLLPMLATFAVLVAVLGRRLTGLWWAGPAAAVATFFVLAPNPYPWPLHGWFSSFATSPYDDGSSFRLVLWTSPTHTFAAMLFAALMLVLVGVLDRKGAGAGPWVLVTLLMIAVMGAKATFLPMLFAGLLLVILVHLVIRRRLHRPALVAAAMALACLVFAQLVLFGGAAQGLQFDPLHQMRISGAPYTTGFTTSPHTRMWRLLLAAAITIVCWACVWAGIAGLLARRRSRLADPAVILFLGMGAAGIGGILLFGHEGGAEGWFLVSARPYLSLAAVVGLAAVTSVRAATRPVVLGLLGAAVAGALLVAAVRELGDPTAPTVYRIGGYWRLAFALTWPYAILVGTGVLTALVVWRYRSRGLALALLVSLLAGMGLYSTGNLIAGSVVASTERGWRDVLNTSPFITEGTMEAGRWLRDHSGPDELIATNAHCVPYPGTSTKLCDNRHFFVAAYSERRLLVEGWGFTNATHVRAKQTGEDLVHVSYWNPEKLAINDLAFEAPSAETIGRLRDTYGVRWLFVDERHSAPAAPFHKYTTLRFRWADCAIYEINPTALSGG